MKPFLTTKRKMLELLILLGLVILTSFLWPLEVVMLFVLGYIWNWTASQQLAFAESHRYRYSMIRMIGSFQNWAVKPIQHFPEPLKLIPRALPAGLFWCVVIFFTQSAMPWWATFLGSLVFELTQFDTYFSRRKEEGTI